MRRATRIAAYLCLLLVLNEFGPAHFRKIAKYDGLLKKSSERKSAVDDNNNGAEKRSVAGKVGTWLLNALTVSATVLDTLTSIATVITTFYNLVTQCCTGQYSDTCKWTEEAQNIKDELDLKTKEINEIILQTKNLEAALLVASDEFRHTVMTMHDIGEASGRLLQSLDPTAMSKLDQTSKNLTKLIAEKNATEERVSYITIETTYFNVLDGVLGIAVPIVTTIIPAIPKLKIWVKSRMGKYKTYELEQPLEPPDKNSDRYKASKSWFGKKASKITYKVDQLNYKLQTKYDKSLSIAKNIKQGFDAVISIAKTAYGIYFLYKALTKCKDAYDNAREAVEQMRAAKEKMSEIYLGVIGARDTMNEARDNLHNQLKSDIFLSDLEELKGTLEKLLGEGTDKEFENIITGVGDYINSIKNNTDQTFLASSKLITELSASLARVPEYFNCYSAKASVARSTLEDCKRGDGTITQINRKAQELFESNAASCQEKIGMEPFSDETLQSMIDENAKEMNFSRVCEANDETKEKIVCVRYCEDKDQDKDELSQTFGISVEAAEIFIERCNCLTEDVKKIICTLKEKGITTENILTIYPRLTAEQIESLDCSNSQ